MTSVLAVLLIGEAVLSVVAGLQLWPTASALASARAGDPAIVGSVRILGVFDWAPHPEVLYIVLVLLAGGIGSSVHALTSLTSYIGNRKFRSSWTAWYVARYPIGASLSLVLYFLLRGGLLSVGSSSASTINIYAMVAVAGLAGMFSKQATDKLEEVFDTLFSTTQGGDASRSDKLDAETEINSLPPRGHAS